MARVEGVDYSPEAVEGIREELVALRNEALNQAEFHWAVLFSHTLVYLAEYKELLEK